MRQTAWFSVAPPESPAEIILEIGKLDEIVGAQLPNTSCPGMLFFEPKEDKLEKYLDEKLSRRQIERGLSFLLESRKKLPSSQGRPR